MLFLLAALPSLLFTFANAAPGGSSLGGVYSVGSLIIAVFSIPFQLIFNSILVQIQFNSISIQFHFNFSISI